MGCIELKGPYDQLIEGLMHHVNQDCGRTFKAKCYEQGTREGSIVMYKRDSYPYGAIGGVSFIWKACNQEQTRTLWIWTEPLCYKQIANEIRFTFNLEENNSNFSEWTPPVLKKPKLLNATMAPKKIVTTAEVLCFTKGDVTMTLLKGTLNRLRLTGPLSNSVLNRLLYPATTDDPNNCIKQNKWWSSHLDNYKNSTVIQKQLWESFSGSDRPESYQSNCVIGFNTIDPRLRFPNKRTKALPNSKGFKWLCFYYLYLADCLSDIVI